MDAALEDKVVKAIGARDKELLAKLLSEAGPGALAGCGAKVKGMLRASLIHGRIVEAKLLLGAGAMAGDSRGDPLLVMLCEGGGTESVELLLKAGADPDARNLYGNTALMVAGFHGHKEVAECLLDSGADPHLRDSKGLTAGDIARLAAERSEPGSLWAERHNNCALVLVEREVGKTLREAVADIAPRAPSKKV